MYSKIKDIAISFKTTDFYENQNNIKTVMFTKVDIALSEKTGKAIKLMNLQILRVAFAESVRNFYIEIVRKSNPRQNNRRADKQYYSYHWEYIRCHKKYRGCK